MKDREESEGEDPQRSGGAVDREEGRWWRPSFAGQLKSRSAGTWQQNRD